MKRLALILMLILLPSIAYALGGSGGGGSGGASSSAPLSGAGTVGSPITLPTTADFSVAGEIITGEGALTTSIGCVGAGQGTWPCAQGATVQISSNTTGSGNNQNAALDIYHATSGHGIRMFAPGGGYTGGKGISGWWDGGGLSLITAVQISGHTNSQTGNPAGLVILNPTADPNMLSIWADVNAPALVIAPNGNTGAASQNLALYDYNSGTPNIRMAIDGAGKMQWAPDGKTTYATGLFDTNLYRFAATTVGADAGLTANGDSIKSLQLGDPTGLTVTPTGGAATQRCYQVACLDNDGFSTIPIAQVCDAAGPTTLDVTHLETVSWTPPTGYAKCDVYGRATGAELLMTPSHLAFGTTTFVDDGSVTPSGAKPTINRTASGYFAGNVLLDGTNYRIGGTHNLVVSNNGGNPIYSEGTSGHVNATSYDLGAGSPTVSVSGSRILLADNGLGGWAGTNIGSPLKLPSYTVATLPATCVKLDMVEVSDATSVAAGACIGGAGTAVLAICSATNTWSCL